MALRTDATWLACPGPGPAWEGGGEGTYRVYSNIPTTTTSDDDNWQYQVCWQCACYRYLYLWDCCRELCVRDCVCVCASRLSALSAAPPAKNKEENNNNNTTQEKNNKICHTYSSNFLRKKNKTSHNNKTANNYFFQLRYGKKRQCAMCSLFPFPLVGVPGKSKPIAD